MADQKDSSMSKTMLPSKEQQKQQEPQVKNVEMTTKTVQQSNTIVPQKTQSKTMIPLAEVKGVQQPPPPPPPPPKTLAQQSSQSKIMPPATTPLAQNVGSKFLPPQQPPTAAGAAASKVQQQSTMNIKLSRPPSIVGMANTSTTVKNITKSLIGKSPKTLMKNNALQTLVKKSPIALSKSAHQLIPVATASIPKISDKLIKGSELLAKSNQSAASAAMIKSSIVSNGKSSSAAESSIETRETLSIKISQGKEVTEITQVIERKTPKSKRNKRSSKSSPSPTIRRSPSKKMLDKTSVLVKRHQDLPALKEFSKKNTGDPYLIKESIIKTSSKPDTTPAIALRKIESKEPIVLPKKAEVTEKESITVRPSSMISIDKSIMDSGGHKSAISTPATTTTAPTTTSITDMKSMSSQSPRRHSPKRRSRSKIDDGEISVTTRRSITTQDAGLGDPGKIKQVDHIRAKIVQTVPSTTIKSKEQRLREERNELIYSCTLNLLAQLIAISMLILLALLLHQFFNGFNVQTLDTLFNYHPWLMVFATVYLCGNSLLFQTPIGRSYGFIRSLLIFSMCLVVTAASVITIYWHFKKDMTHFLTLHSWFGFITIAMIIVYTYSNGYLYCSRNGRLILKAANDSSVQSLKNVRMIGVATLLMSVTTSLLGINQLASFMPLNIDGKNASLLSSYKLLINIIAVFMFLFAIFCIYLSNRLRLRSKEQEEWEERVRMAVDKAMENMQASGVFDSPTSSASPRSRSSSSSIGKRKRSSKRRRRSGSRSRSGNSQRIKSGRKSKKSSRITVTTSDTSLKSKSKPKSKRTKRTSSSTTSTTLKSSSSLGGGGGGGSVKQKSSTATIRVRSKLSDDSNQSKIVGRTNVDSLVANKQSNIIDSWNTNNNTSVLSDITSQTVSSTSHSHHH